MKIKTLKNGMRIIIDRAKTDTKLVQMGIYIIGGSYTESRKTIEYYHFFEHLLSYFTSKKWPDARKNLKRFNRKGIQYYGTTSDYETHIHLTGIVDGSAIDVHNVMLDSLTEMLLHFQIDNTVFDQEKMAIQSELSGLLNDPFVKLKDQANKIFTPKHPVNISTQSRLKAVQLITPDDIAEFFKHAVVPSRTVFYMVGNIPRANVFDKFKRKLESIQPSRPAFSMNSLKRYSTENKPGIFHIKQPSVTTRLHFRWRIPVLTFDNDNVAMIDYIAYALKKKLYNILHSKLGLVYDITARTFFDPINKHLSYAYIETDSMTPTRAKTIVLEIVKVLSEMDKVLTRDILEDFVKNEQSKYEKYEKRLTITKDLGVNVSRVLFDKPLVSPKKMLHLAKNIDIERTITFAKKILCIDELYLMYSGSRDIFE